MSTTVPSFQEFLASQQHVTSMDQVVVGNAAGDADSIISALTYGYIQQVLPTKGVPPQIIPRHLLEAGRLAVQKVLDLAIPFEGDKKKDMLLKCAGTALNSKLIASHQDLFAPMVVDAVTLLAEKDRLDDVNTLVGIKLIPGGDVRQSFWVQGVAFKKTFSYV